MSEVDVDLEAVKCIELSKFFGKNRAADDLNLTVKEGSIVSLVGGNGSGKTTLLKILATLVAPSSGSARIFGIDTLENPNSLRQMIGFVPSEERSFYWRLTGRQNLRFFAALHGLGGAEAADRLESLLESVGLKDRGDELFSTYSTGMKQALGIARALLHDPQLLLLDEPFRSLDLETEDRVRNMLLRLVREEGKTILMASHNLREVETLADRVVIMKEGRIMAEGSRDDLQQLSGLTSSDLGAICNYFSRNGEKQ